MGRPVTLFFTFWGSSADKGKQVKVQKSLIGGQVRGMMRAVPASSRSVG
jgi:peroxiredoxin family protein